MKKGAVLLPCICIYASACCQFNDSVHYYMHIASTGTVNNTTDGNSFISNNNLKFSEHKKSITLNLNSSWIYGKSQQTLTNNDFSGSLDANWYKTFPHFYYWVLATYESSLSLNINYRQQAGLGAAYNIIDHKNAQLNLSDGILYENSDLYLADKTHDIYHTFRNSFRLRYHWSIKDIVVLDGTNFLQNSLSYKNDYIIKCDNSLSVKLRKWLSITAAVNYNKLNRTRRENLLVTYGITMEKYF